MSSDFVGTSAGLSTLTSSSNGNFQSDQSSHLSEGDACWLLSVSSLALSKGDAFSSGCATAKRQTPARTIRCMPQHVLRKSLVRKSQTNRHSTNFPVHLELGLNCGSLRFLYALAPRNYGPKIPHDYRRHRILTTLREFANVFFLNYMFACSRFARRGEGARTCKKCCDMSVANTIAFNETQQEYYTPISSQNGDNAARVWMLSTRCLCCALQHICTDRIDME